MRQWLVSLSLIVLLSLVLILQTHVAKTHDAIKTIAITQIIAHSALDESRQGIKDALKEAGYIPGKTIRILYENAQGNSQLAVQIAHKLCEQSPDILVPISTLSTESIVKANKNNIPVVFATVTDPVSAGIVKSFMHRGENITGAIEMPPITEALQLLKRILPHIKRIGVIYSASENNSIATVNRLKSLTKLEIVERTVNSSLELKSATQSLANQVDVIYLPSDNTVWTALDVVTTAATEKKIPVMSADPASIQHGVTIALGYRQYDVGRAAGELIVKILKGTSATDLPIQKPKEMTLALNLCSARKNNLHIPKDMMAKAKWRIHDCS